MSEPEKMPSEHSDGTPYPDKIKTRHRQYWRQHNMYMLTDINTKPPAGKNQINKLCKINYGKVLYICLPFTYTSICKQT